MVDSGRIGRRGAARLLMVCAVLAGLFLMHGAPASAAEGCHGVTLTPMAVSAAGNSGAAATSAAPVASGVRGAMAYAGGEQAPRSAQAVSAGAPSMEHGQMCVSTPARERVLLPSSVLPAVAAVLTAWALDGRAVVDRQVGRRGPPPTGGRDLLLRVGVART